MISKDKQYRTRDGSEVRIYATDAGDRWPIHGAVKRGDHWSVKSWTEKGWFDSDNAISIDDLVEVKPRIKREVWLNVYDGDVVSYCTREMADKHAGSSRLACVKIVIDCEHGEGL